MDTPPTWQPSGPASSVHRSAHLGTSIALLIAGIALGAGAMWYFNRPAAQTPDTSPSPSVMASPSVSATPQGGISTVTFRTLQAPNCTANPGTGGHYMVIIDGKDIGEISTPFSCDIGPSVVRAGKGWAIVQIAPEGLGGYSLYPSHYNVHFVSATGRIVTLGSSSVWAFSADGKWGAYAGGGKGGFYLQIFDFLKGLQVPNKEFGPIPGTLDGQVALPIFSPDASKIALLVWHGPENERGEIYIANVDNYTGWTKVADVPRPPTELFWKADGTVSWR